MLWGAILLYFYQSGRLLFQKNTASGYLDISFCTPVLLAGIVLIILGLFNFFTKNIEAHCHHDHSEPHNHSHEHPTLGNGSLMSFLFYSFFLITPITIASVYTPDRLSAQAILNKQRSKKSPFVPQQFTINKSKNSTGINTPITSDTLALPAFTLKDFEAQVPKNENGRYPLEVPELFYTANDSEIRDIVSGLPIVTIGQVMPKNKGDESEMRRIFRLYIECCIADAEPLSISISKSPQTLRDLSWVKVKGTMTYQTENNVVVPILEVESVEETDKPEDQSLY